MICAMDTKGRTVFVSDKRIELESYTTEIKANGERYRIRERSIKAGGASVVLYVLTIYPKE